MKTTKLIFLLLIGLILGLSSITTRAATWYLQPGATGDWNTLTNWNSQPLGTGTNPGSISSSDNFDLNASGTVDTPKLTSGTTTFGGNALILHGGLAGYIATKTTPPAVVAIPNLYSYGGFISNNSGSGSLAIHINTLQLNGAGANTTLSGGTSTRGLGFTISSMTGAGNLTAIGAGGGAVGGAVTLNVTTATSWTGTLFIANGCQFTFENGMISGGALNVEGAGTKVTLNNATVSFNGLTLSGTAMATGTYSAATLGFSGTGNVIVQTPTPQAYSVQNAYGVNLPGGSFSSGSYYPTDGREWSYYQGKNLNLIRVAFLWERVQPALNGTLNASAMSSLYTSCTLAAARGMEVILDMHNYDRYTISGTSYLIGSTQVPYSAYQNAWQQLAAYFANVPGVYGYDIMNEPNGDSGTWNSTAAQYGVNGVRLSDTTHNIIVEGDSYAGAQSWMGSNEKLNVTDSANKLIYSAHTYWDSNDSGVYAGTYDSNNVYPNVGVDRVAPFIYWLGLKGAKGYVGEFGVPNNVSSPDYRWNEALDNFLYYLNDNGVEATYWSGGECWGTSYALSCATGTPPVDAPAMTVLETYGAAPWMNQNIGDALATGTTTYSSGTYTVSGEGTEFISTGTDDAFQFAYQSASGDCSITARVATLTGGDTIKGEGAVMIRNDLTAGSICATVGVSTGRSVNFTYRTATSGTSSNVEGASGKTAPYWVQVVRSGSTFTAYTAPDGVTWTQCGTAQTITMGTNVYIGLATCGHSSSLQTATFDNVTISN